MELSDDETTDTSDIMEKVGTLYEELENNGINNFQLEHEEWILDDSEQNDAMSDNGERKDDRHSQDKQDSILNNYF